MLGSDLNDGVSAGINELRHDRGKRIKFAQCGEGSLSR
jgi:hypothetical protein